MPKTIIVMPAFNVAGVLEKTIKALPIGCWDEIIVVNDGSKDNTAQIAARLGCHVVTHPQNRGYGGAQKTGYKEALTRGADMVVMVHGDNQYDPSLVPEFVRKMTEEKCDLVTGTRMVLGDVLKSGMPLWKFIPNRFLTWIENVSFGSNISDYHNGFRAYSAKFLREIPLDLLSEKFDFDTDIIIQGAIRKYKIGEVPHPTRYLKENSQMPFSKAIVYGLSILKTVWGFWLHKTGICRQQIYSL
ncbi:MAG: glycosyltransferase family 2 protein [Candidatus Omnitrophica bacterium]|nr:glycosyltransferase family 2 protein [Candidatus Omnitrophota bacterium]